MLELASRAVYQASDLVWGWWTIALLLGTGLFLTIRFGAPQVTRLPQAADG